MTAGDMSGRSLVRDEWDAQSLPYEPIPGIYALYQDDVLKYVGQSYDCAYRIIVNGH